jgi:pimeloyl-ACP methyl ester carboxylesterase
MSAFSTKAYKRRRRLWRIEDIPPRHGADLWHRLANRALYRLVVGAESEFHRQLEVATVPGAGHMRHHENPAGSAQAG